MTTTQEPKQKRTWTEQIEVTGDELKKRVEELVEEGNVRRLIVRNEHGDTLMEIPLTAGVAIGGVVTIFNPVLTALGALGAMLAHLKIEVVRTEADED
ncbi:MAG: DUF4342 domain-containing protein [Nitrolancea sp.]